jgi:hypothetical protein
MTNTELLLELDNRIGWAEEEARESHKVAMNSYGAGYDRGFAEALKEIRNLVNENYVVGG